MIKTCAGIWIEDRQRQLTNVRRCVHTSKEAARKSGKHENNVENDVEEDT